MNQFLYVMVEFYNLLYSANYVILLHTVLAALCMIVCHLANSSISLEYLLQLHMSTFFQELSTNFMNGAKRKFVKIIFTDDIGGVCRYTRELACMHYSHS